MRFSLRLMVLLVAGILTVIVLAVWSEIRAEEFALQVELQQRAEIAADHLRDAVEPALRQRSAKSLSTSIERLVLRERLAGVAVFDAERKPVIVSGMLSDAAGGGPSLGPDCTSVQGCGRFLGVGGRPMYAFSTPLYTDLKMAGTFTLFLVASAISATSGRIWRNAFLFVVPTIGLILLVTYFVVHAIVLAPIARTARWMRELRFGQVTTPDTTTHGGLFEPISSEAANLAQSLATAQASAEAEARLR